MKRLWMFAFALLLAGCAAGEVSPPQFLGSESAPVVIEEFSDLQCPACAAISPQIADIVKKNPDRLKLVYYHFPLSQHTFARPAAEAAECAGDQGKFWEFIHEVFRRQPELGGDDFLTNVATGLGLDETVFNECVKSGSKKATVLNHLSLGTRRGVSYTPYVMVNGQVVRFTGPDAFEAYVNSL